MCVLQYEFEWTTHRQHLQMKAHHKPKIWDAYNNAARFKASTHEHVHSDKDTKITSEVQSFYINPIKRFASQDTAQNVNAQSFVGNIQPVQTFCLNARATLVAIRKPKFIGATTSRPLLTYVLTSFFTRSSEFPIDRFVSSSRSPLAIPFGKWQISRGICQEILTSCHEIRFDSSWPYANQNS